MNCDLGGHCYRSHWNCNIKLPQVTYHISELWSSRSIIYIHPYTISQIVCVPRRSPRFLSILEGWVAYICARNFAILPMNSWKTNQIPIKASSFSGFAFIILLCLMYCRSRNFGGTKIWRFWPSEQVCGTKFWSLTCPLLYNPT